MSSDPFTALVQSFRGIDIYVRYSEPPSLNGLVVLVHGFGEHSGRYQENVIPALLDCGLAVVAYDNIGHGKSGGKKGHCPGYEALLDLLEDMIQKAESLFENLPLFLYGHSMGGNLVLNYALRRKHHLRGIIATSPYLRLAFDPPKWKMVLGRLLMHIHPSMTMPSGLDANGISRIEKEVEKYKSDPLIHDQVSPMYSFPIMDAGRWAIDNAKKLQTDTLLLHGTADPIIDYGATEAFHKNAKTTELELFEDAYHELHNDLCREAMMQTVKNWLGQRV